MVQIRNQEKVERSGIDDRIDAIQYAATPGRLGLDRRDGEIANLQLAWPGPLSNRRLRSRARRGQAYRARRSHDMREGKRQIVNRLGARVLPAHPQLPASVKPERAV